MARAKSSAPNKSFTRVVNNGKREARRKGRIPLKSLTPPSMKKNKR